MMETISLQISGETLTLGRTPSMILATLRQKVAQHGPHSIIALQYFCDAIAAGVRCISAIFYVQ